MPEQQPPPKILVTAAEAARLLSIGESTLWRLARAGKLPEPVKIGGATRWRVADLQAIGGPVPPLAAGDLHSEPS